MPTRLVRGDLDVAHGSGAHAWNVVRCAHICCCCSSTNGKGVVQSCLWCRVDGEHLLMDVMQHPGNLYSSDSRQAEFYKRTGCFGGPAGGAGQDSMDDQGPGAISCCLHA